MMWHKMPISVRRSDACVCVCVIYELVRPFAIWPFRTVPARQYTLSESNKVGHAADFGEIRCPPGRALKRDSIEDFLWCWMLIPTQTPVAAV